ncbi:MAG: sugar kinase [Candidatus Bathyarchaeia archaeon]
MIEEVTGLDFLDFISIGEVLIQLNSIAPGPLRYSRYFEVHVAGSEFNVLAALSKLGFLTGLITRVGRDEFGEMIIRAMRAENIDTSLVKTMDDAPTGVYFIQRHYPVPGKSTVFYYRHGSAASLMSEEDVREEYVLKSKRVFLTGITPALSDSCYSAVRKLHSIARDNGREIFFDTNIRLKLWRSAEKARARLTPLLEGSKIVFTNKEDIQILYPQKTLQEAVSSVFDLDVDLVVVKSGEEGSTVYSRSGESHHEKAYFTPVIEDVIGAGDAFDAVFIASVIKGYSLKDSLKLANLAGMLVVTTRGDVEAQPDWKALEALKKYYDEKIDMLR